MSYQDDVLSALRESNAVARETFAVLSRMEILLTAQTPLPSVALARPASVGRPFHTNPARTAATVEPCFAALAEIEGSHLGQLSEQGAKVIQHALEEIRRATRDVTADEIRQRAARFKRKWATWDLTANSLAKHWAKLAGMPPPSNIRIPPEPQDWAARFVDLYGKNGWEQMEGEPQRVTRPHPNGSGYQVLRWPDLGTPAGGNLWSEFS